MSGMAKRGGPGVKALMRALRALSAPGVFLSREGEGEDARWQILRKGRSASPLLDDVVETLVCRDFLSWTANGYQVSPAGRKALKRFLGEGEGFLEQHREMAHSVCSGVSAGAVERLTVNLKESPLAWLASRKDKNGEAFLSSDRIAAGERLRRDYEFARLTPSFGSTWKMEATGKGRIGAQTAGAEFSNDVQAARDRIQATLAALEPTLAGVLVDVCCHLKGVSEVEAARDLPARSGKAILKIALGCLSDIYGYRMTAPEKRGQIRVSRGS
ncbi:DUF6456 domain-containing protein [Roseibium sp. RKSG952]|uniref:DUF6456 domain-containing protein n=1 Tax=Roseibium sp. RKSG952 TaxID=2529384 RepID=UPI0012BC7B30|nr:DUF6456 domain-containing protein [Roseibium sp. RKSG952]MTH97286.1 hypothetical protein [Roseibium sp. RKSG952]